MSPRSAKEEGSILSIQTPLDDTRRVGPERAEGWPARFMASESHHHRDQVRLRPFSLFVLVIRLLLHAHRASQRLCVPADSFLFFSPAPLVSLSVFLSLLSPTAALTCSRRAKYSQLTTAAPSHNATDFRKRKRAWS